MCFYEYGRIIAASAIPWTYITGCTVTIAVVLLFKELFGNSLKNGLPIPPGPPATWFWKDPMPTKHIAHTLTTFVEQYGPIVSLRRGGAVTIIIGRMDAANEIMEKEGAALVDRPRLSPAVGLVPGAARLIFEHVGERLRRLRRAALANLQPKAAKAYEEIQAKAVKDVVLDILNDPNRYLDHAQRFASAVILRVAYGKTTPTSTDDQEVVRILRLLTNFQEMLRPGAYLVNRIPWLKYVPGYGRQLKGYHQEELALFQEQLCRVKSDMAENNAGPSFAKMLLENGDGHRLSNEEMAYLAGGLFSAGSHTTASGIVVMIMAAVCHPDAQAQVQEELEEVVGRDRVPTFEDWDMLPQLHAFMLEALRWRPVLPIGMSLSSPSDSKLNRFNICVYPGFAHRAMKDIIWRGQCIPAGATVLGCHWSISRDPVVFPDPETFNPRRWLTEDGRVRTDLHFYTYGFGRRVCPGQHVANRSLYINLAFLLWSFRISQRPDAPINLGLGSFRDGIAFDPEPFEVDFVPRIEKRRLRELMA